MVTLSRHLYDQEVGFSPIMIVLLNVSGIPFGSVNLLDGVDENESKVKSSCTILLHLFFILLPAFCNFLQLATWRGVTFLLDFMYWWILFIEITSSKRKDYKHPN